MKIRTGFVSNSSSSSFIVILPKHLGNSDAMGKELFKGDWDPTAIVEAPTAIVEASDIKYPQKDIAERVYADYCKHKKRSAEERRTELISQFRSLSHQMWYMHNSSVQDFAGNIRDDCPSELLTVMSEGEKASEAHMELYHIKNKSKEEKTLEKTLTAKRQACFLKEEEIRTAWATKKADEYLKKYQDYTILTVEYSDNGGPFETLLEHGNIFQAVVYERVSHH